MKSVARALAAAVAKAAWSVPNFRMTMLWAMTSFGIAGEPIAWRRMCSASPGLAGMVATLYFMSSPAVISTVRGLAWARTTTGAAISASRRMADEKRVWLMMSVR